MFSKFPEKKICTASKPDSENSYVPTERIKIDEYMIGNKKVNTYFNLFHVREEYWKYSIDREIFISMNLPLYRLKEYCKPLNDEELKNLLDDLAKGDPFFGEVDFDSLKKYYDNLKE